MKKLLFYLDRRSRGGAQRVMTELCGYFADNGSRFWGEPCEVILACQFEVPEKPYALSENVKEVILPPPSANKFKRQADRIKALTRLCEEEEPDIIISFLIVTNIIAIQVGNSLGIPVLISVRNDPGRDGSRIQKLLIKKYYPKASGCVFQTEQAMDHFSFRYPTAVIMNPLSKEVLDKLCKQDAGSLSSVSRLISVGRLEMQKRHDLTLEAFALAVKTVPNLTLTIYGQGPLEHDLELEAELLGIKDKVTFAGITDDIVPELSKAGVFIMSSDYEGMPNALMEAMAAGLCCISSDCPCGGPASLIEDGKNGYLFEIGDAKQLSDRIVYLQKNPAAAAKVGEKAVSLRDSCRMESIAPKWRDIIDRCLKKQP